MPARFRSTARGSSCSSTRPRADLDDDDAVEQVYYPEIEALLRAVTGASRVVIFDATRRSDAGARAKNRDGQRGPATRVHVDYTARSGPQRVKDLLGESEAARLAASGARIIQINVWRPIRGPVQRSPLALADASSVRPEDLIATDQVFPDRVGEIYHLAYDPAQRWYYAPAMTAGRGVADQRLGQPRGWPRALHPARRVRPAGHAGRTHRPRESIEVRTLVVIEA